MSLLAVLLVRAVGLANPHIAQEFGLSQADANVVMAYVIAGSVDVAIFEPWLLPEMGVVDAIYWWAGYASVVNW